MGKTTYCQKLAYDWANRQEEWDESFPEIELLLLLRCHDIKSNIWEAIEEHILPEDINEESKETFFKFIRANQSKVLLVLDGLDEADPSKLPMYIKLAESRELPECRIILTSRQEVGLKFRRFCDTLWEIVGFTEDDAESFIFKHFKDMKHLADKLLQKLSSRSGSSHLHEMTSNPLNTALLCFLWEDFEGDLPTSRTQLYIEIVLCVLRRYEKKKGLSSNNKDLIKVYEEELIHLGDMALISLRKGELYIEESESGSNSTALSKFGFLSVQAAGSRRKPCLRYGFLHKSFQEFFAGFYLALKILSGEIDLDTVVTDKRYLNELKQVFLFMSGMVSSQCEETALCLLASITAHINCFGHCTPDEDKNIISINMCMSFAFDFIKECITYKEKLQSRLLCTFGSHLDLKKIQVTSYLPNYFNSVEYFGFFCTGLAVNTTLTNLNWSGKGIGDPGAGCLSDALTVNITLTRLKLAANGICESGADSLSKTLTVSSTLTHLNLSANRIGDSGASSLSKALTANSTLTHLDLRMNGIGDSGAGSLSDALTVNSTLTHLDLRMDGIGESGAGSLSDALTVNSTLTHLDLQMNGIGSSGAVSLFKAIAVNSTLTHLNLSANEISGSGAGYLSKALTVNTALKCLDLSWNGIGASGAGSICKPLTVNTTLTHLGLRGNEISNSGAGSLSDALTVNSTLTYLDLSVNGIDDSGAGSLSEALTVNTTLTHLDLSTNGIGDSGAGSISKALAVNSTLTHLDLRKNVIGPSGRAFLSHTQTVNNTCIVEFKLQFSLVICTSCS